MVIEVGKRIRGNASEVSDISGFGGLTLNEVLLGCEGFVTSISFKKDHSICSASGPEIATLPGSLKVLKYTESGDLAHGVPELYPALRFTKHIEYNNALITTFQRKDYKRIKTQKDAAIELLKVLFKDISPVNAGKIFKEWIEILNYHTDQFTSKSISRGNGLETTEGYLLFALGQIGIDDIRMLNNSFSKVIEPKLKLLDTTKQYQDSTYGIGRITTVLPFILPFENKPNPALLNDSNGGKDEVKRSLINISTYAQKIISKAVLECL